MLPLSEKQSYQSTPFGDGNLTPRVMVAGAGSAERCLGAIWSKRLPTAGPLYDRDIATYKSLHSETAFDRTPLKGSAGGRPDPALAGSPWQGHGKIRPPWEKGGWRRRRLSPWTADGHGIRPACREPAPTSPSFPRL
jgi:hypothetical protein